MQFTVTINYDPCRTARALTEILCIMPLVNPVAHANDTQNGISIDKLNVHRFVCFEKFSPIIASHSAAEVMKTAQNFDTRTLCEYIREICTKCMLPTSTAYIDEQRLCG
jgi:hypothetical protein